MEGGIVKGGSLNWAILYPLPLTPGKILVIPHCQVTSQGGPPTPDLQGRTDCHLSEGSNNCPVHLCAPKPRTTLNTLESLKRAQVRNLTHMWNLK